MNNSTFNQKKLWNRQTNRDEEGLNWHPEP